MWMMPFRRFAVAVVAAILLAAAAQARAQAPTLEDCRAEISENPANPVVYYCVYRSVLAYGRADEAAALLRRSYEENPRVFRIGMFIAWIDRMRGEEGSDQILRQAIDGMESTGDVHGVVYGGLELAYRLGEGGEFEDAEALLERCARAARETGDPAMEARVWVGQASLARWYADYSRWLHLTLRAERVVFPDGPYDLKCGVLDNLGAAYWYLCRYEKAYEAFERAAAIRAQAHDLWGQAGSVYNMALCGGNLVREGRMETAEYTGLLDRGIDLAVASGNLKAEAEMSILLGLQLGGERSVQHFARSLEIADRQGLTQIEINALRSSGVAMVEMGPEFRREGELRLLEAGERASEAGQSVLLVEVVAAEARLKARHSSPEEAVESHLETIDLIEAIRAPRVEGAVRAQAFSRWIDVYYRLAGFLLQSAAASDTPDRDTETAFQTVERFRARELLERVQAARGGRRTEIRNAASPERDEILARIAGVQRRLSDPGLSAAKRRAALDELAELEAVESELRDRLLRESRESAALHRPAIPSVAEIQALLAPDQALLSYHLWDGESSSRPPLEIGASWLIVVTRDRIQSFALPRRRDLRGRVEILEGLLATRGAPSDTAIGTSIRLYDDLLRKAMAALPEEIRRLVVIPDDVLFRCPFAALRSTPDSAPLGSDVEISVVPSAAVWAHLKDASRARPHQPAPAALIMYAPAIGEIDPEALGFRAADPWVEGLRLAPLRHAEREARSLERVAGKESLVLSGPEASERALKDTPLGAFGIIDLVTHAVVDEEQPERSAILLAPGSADEDGFLQVREIPDLELDGQLVILSSCRSSSGAILGGEGAQSLARAFLEARAGAVLASLWPLEDEEASILLSSFAGSLGRGRSVAGALSAAQRDAADAGMPAASWAGLVILGDGDLTPLPAEPGRAGVWVLIGVAVVASFGVLRFAGSRRGSR
jgi:CHAT domain-containing protein/tetratricopeptide (TPR) repeat protein